jgi:ubiquinone/menaquinone biosynthesis C-methylase UbiE
MSFYQDQIVPLLINLSMRWKNFVAYRSRIVPAAKGRVLEIGIGSGLNLPFYSSNVRHVIGLDPSPKLLAMAQRASRQRSQSVELIEGSAEKIPVENATVDTVVTTWTLCSIPMPTKRSAKCAASSNRAGVCCSSSMAGRLIRMWFGGRTG